MRVIKSKYRSLRFKSFENGSFLERSQFVYLILSTPAFEALRDL